METKIQLSRVAVVGLFGLFDHTINLQTEDRVTILHGPNGVGKTVILRLIQEFFGGRYETLLETNFASFYVELTDGRSVSVRRDINTTSSEETRPVLTIESMSAPQEVFRWARDKVQYHRMAQLIDGEVHHITRVAEELWSDDITGETYNVTQLVRKFRDVLPDKLKTTLADDPAWLREFRASVTVHFVETQRLLSADANVDPRHYPRHMQPRKFASTVKNYSGNLRKRMAEALTAYAEHSQTLDRSFPQRMLGGPRPAGLDTLALKDRMNKLEQRRIQLKKIGLIEDDTSYPFDIDTLDAADPMQRTVMTLYVEDTENKLSVLDDLERKVDLLLGNINRKFGSNKQLRADRRSGLTVRDKRNVRIDLDSLSSGEQHELVLIYDLLFQVKPQSLVLIDEPELSLHVTWQKAFLCELLTIIDAVDFDVLIATHSPFIIGDRVDLMVPLELQPDDQEAVREVAQEQLPVSQ